VPQIDLDPRVSTDQEYRVRVGAPKRVIRHWTKA
jgi:hypothetical protein